MTRGFWVEYDKPELPHQFQVDEPATRWTGLWDMNGDKIMASPEPIGYVTDFTHLRPRVRVKAGRHPF